MLPFGRFYFDFTANGGDEKSEEFSSTKKGGFVFISIFLLSFLMYFSLVVVFLFGVQLATKCLTAVRPSLVEHSVGVCLSLFVAAHINRS